jgi:predicted Rossmann fold nucleotide-binding protein DprA/Smf involved in DNA uptake
MRREELIATVQRITELRAQVAQLATLQKELKRLEALVDSVAGVTSEPTQPRQRDGNSIGDKLEQFLQQNAERDWSAEELAEKVGAKVPTVRASLSKLRKAGRIIDTHRGYVQAKPAESSESQEDHPIAVPEAA